jgi:hypothetical protein
MIEADWFVRARDSRYAVEAFETRLPPFVSHILVEYTVSFGNFRRLYEITLGE